MMSLSVRSPRFLLSLAIGLGLLTPAVQAQRVSLGDRVAALERQASANQSNVDLLNQVNQLKAEVQALRAQIEELQHQAEQGRATSRSQYLDLDGRLNRLEGGSAAGNPTPPTAGVSMPQSASSTPAPTMSGSSGDAGVPAMANAPAGERAAYEAAFAVLKDGRYAEASRAFLAFLQEYPAGAYAANARYWLGESYYVTQNYSLALEQFQQLHRAYPQHDKAAGALLKVGLSHYGLSQLDEAEAVLTQVQQQYPGTDAARTAGDRLRAIQIARAQ